MSATTTSYRHGAKPQPHNPPWRARSMRQRQAREDFRKKSTLFICIVFLWLRMQKHQISPNPSTPSVKYLYILHEKSTRIRSFFVPLRDKLP